MTKYAEKLPALVLHDVVMFPKMVLSLIIEKESSIMALENARKHHGGKILIVAQKASKSKGIKIKDVFKVGVISKIVQVLRLKNANAKVIIEGIEKVKLCNLEMQEEGFVKADVEIILEEVSSNEREAKILKQSVREQFERYANIYQKISNNVISDVIGIENPLLFANTICSHITMPLEKKQKLLEINDSNKKLESLLVFINGEIEYLKTESKIRNRIKTQIEKNQKDYYLHEQLKAIHKELGDDEVEMDGFESRIKSIKCSKEIKKKLMSELKKLKGMNFISSEANVIRNYLEVMLDLPWENYSKIKYDLLNAQAQLDGDHYGLKDVKERVIEYLAVNFRKGNTNGPIVCIVGPPGVGKTSLARSIAGATGREFVKVSLGGLRDEAEIRGHRRTYIGALPGKIIQAMRKAGTSNPLILLDEIDKMSSDFRGDPSSALLEVLDPAQNSKFSDHYLEVEYDLSHVMFIATANSINLQKPLLDRMEVIRIPGYTHDEKIEIASKYLIPKQLAEHGLKQGELKLEEDVLHNIVRCYTREAGVRELERSISKIMRKVVKQIVDREQNQNKKGGSVSKPCGKGEELLNIRVNKGDQGDVMLREKALIKDCKSDLVGEVSDSSLDEISYSIISEKNLKDFLGVPKFDYSQVQRKGLVGTVNGLAYTEVGGDLLSIEAAIMVGKGEVKITGKLGDVMKESAQAAVSCIRSRATSLGILPDVFKENDIHIHVPEGAVPKDGPSAGITICTSIVSALTKQPAKSDVAMTGEITLLGNVLPIGGLKEKLLAALQGGVKTVLIPQKNKKDLDEIPQNIKSKLDIQPVENIDEVLKLSLDKVKN